jgi:hypothetical protein
MFSSPRKLSLVPFTSEASIRPGRYQARRKTLYENNIIDHDEIIYDSYIDNSPEFFLDEIENHLYDVQTTGLFAHAEVLESVPNPAIHIPRYGIVVFLLAEHDLKLIISASCAINGQEAGLGKAQNVWKINSNILELKNPSWDNFIKSIALRLQSSLGLKLKAMRQQCLHHCLN